jgi:hypothetical protein
MTRHRPSARADGLLATSTDRILPMLDRHNGGRPADLARRRAPRFGPRGQQPPGPLPAADVIQLPGQTASLSPPAPNPRPPGEGHVGFHHPHALARHRSATENHHAPPKLAKLRASESASLRPTKVVGVSRFVNRVSWPPEKIRSNFADRADPPSVVKRGRLLGPAKYRPALGLAGWTAPHRTRRQPDSNRAPLC